MKLILSLILFLVQISYIKIGYGLNVENSLQIQKKFNHSNTSTKDSLKSMESPSSSISIPIDGNNTDSSILNALAAVLPLKSTSTSGSLSEKKDERASDLSYFEPKVLYTTIPVIVVCMVGIAVMAELFGDGFESGKRRLSMIPDSVKRRGRASI
ncbi:uncharacterized protein cubi_03611 [Cryptosporidium ubiquitum]|uniref:Uncharacterized protein n=1 Tax=Cryptosporidium ubiquitum TaxID=857276 RepID=A0A1J4MHV6_9CRYT|nr:uncharacterized protein cubi_03611 [Cryptosporidium ubiquitum]OII73814.1 hypothetical protein cubi_03611 [Cryptosporidium ubiquitum]